MHQNLTFAIEELTRITPSPCEIWLIGSRANQRAKEDSDWDLVICGSEMFAKAAAAKTFLSDIKLDLLVATNDAELRRLSTWRRAGSLSEWNWKRISSDAAKYEGTKWVPDEESSIEFGAEMGDVERFEETAILMWRFDASKYPTNRCS